jgi:hypothetical protein
MEKHFAKCQESCCKDIKRAFGVLVQQFQILQCPIRNWYWEDIIDILDCCIILHNIMVVESRRENYSVSGFLNSGEEWYVATDPFQPTPNNNNPPPVVSLFKHDDNDGNILLAEAYLATRVAIRVAHLNDQIKHQGEHLSLKADSVNHLWQQRTNQR